jgi:hypothetical protein
MKNPAPAVGGAGGGDSRMAEPAGCHILAVMGSGETSPTMVTTHRTLVGRLRLERPRAVLLETPYRFQVNADDLSARTKRDYFAKSVGLDVTVLAGLRPAAGGTDAGAALVRDADWVFSGPGSPTYALGEWRDSALAGALRDRLLAGRGVTVLASAAAVTIGLAAVPVYEIYKVGTPPRWVDGLDLMSALGLKVAVIPHYDNAEGGSYDTRYCYLGERRLSLLEQELPTDAAVLGVDEHTVAVFDLDAGSVEVSGRGGVTVRRRGASTVLPAGTTIPLAELRDLASRDPARTGTAGPDPASTDPASTGTARPGLGGRRRDSGGGQGGGRPAQAPPDTLPDLMAAAQCRFDAAERDRDAAGMVAAILDLDTAIHAWAADTEEDQGTEQARAVLRSLVTRLGRAAQSGLSDPRERLGPAVEGLITLRGTLREDGSYLAADAIRDALAAAGVRLRDGVDGTRWELEPERRSVE